MSDSFANVHLSLHMCISFTHERNTFANESDVYKYTFAHEFNKCATRDTHLQMSLNCMYVSRVTRDIHTIKTHLQMCISRCKCVSLLHTRDTHLQMSLTCRNTHLQMSLTCRNTHLHISRTCTSHTRLMCKCVFLHVRLICKCVSLVCKRDTHVQQEIHICN